MKPDSVNPSAKPSELEQFKIEMREQLNMLWQMGAYLGTRIENIEGNKMLEQSILYWRQDDDNENDD